jgi:serine protease Do
MKQAFLKLSTLVLAAALFVPVSLVAQEEKEKEKKDKETKDVEQFTIIRKGDSKDKLVIEINGDKITVNGKQIDENNNDGDVTVRRSRFKELGALSRMRGGNGQWNNFGHDALTAYGVAGNQAMLGVTTEKSEKGVEIQSVTKESAAEKIGLKEGDVITKVDDKKITTPDELSKAIRAHKPGEKVSVTYLRAGKEQNATTELTSWKGANVFNAIPGQDFNFDELKDFKMDMKGMEKLRTPLGQTWSYSGGAPKMGLSIQDTDDGKGVKVIEVDDESNAAKAGLKENDVIIEVDGKVVNGAEAMAKVIKESKEKASVSMKVQRAGKTQNIEVKIPKKLKTADL